MSSPATPNLLATHHHILEKIRKDDLLFLIIGNLCIIGFLMLFKPFDLSGTATSKIMLSLAIICPVYSLIFIAVRRVKFHWMLELILVVVIAGLASKLLHWQFGLSGHRLKDVMEWMYGSSLTLAIPLFLRQLLPGEKEKSGVNLPVNAHRVFDNAGQIQELYQLTLDNFLYARAAENYVYIFSIEKGGLKKDMIRSSMSGIEALIADKRITRCHRSYIVNTTKVADLKGNKRGYKAILLEGEFESEIPVSVNKVEEVKVHFHQ